MRKLESLSDDKLMELGKNGQKEKAFGLLYQRYYEKVYNCTLQILKNKEEAEDITSEVFQTMIKKSHLYNPRKFQAWLLRIAHNKSIDAVRKRGGNIEPINEEQDRYFENNYFISEDRNFIEEQIKEEEAEYLRRSVEKLNPEQKQVVYARLWDDKAFNEIAEETKVSINTSLARMRYALMNLRKDESLRQFFQD